MEPARIETMLDHGWSLIGQLHHWLSQQRQAHPDRDELIDLICGLQSFWGRVDDLEMKQLARNSLALEQFFERLCAKKLEMSSEHFKDLRAGICSLELLLLEFEATREESAISDLDSLHRLEKRTSRRFSTESTKRTIEIPNTGGVHIRSIILAEPTEQDDSKSPISVPNTLYLDASEALPRLAMTSFPKRIEQKFVPRLDPFVVTGIETSELLRRSAIADEPVEIESEVPVSVVESNSILILEESLFYRHLISMALQCAGYDSVALEPLRDEASAQDLDLNYRAILVTSSVTIRMHEQIQRSRDASNPFVIGLKANDQDDQFDVELDAIVLKSKPQQLVSVLSQLLKGATDFPRKIA
jgi:hypothetical protein